MAKCDYMRRARTLAEREVGCPLDHCRNGHHIDTGESCIPYERVDCVECRAEGLCPACGGAAHDGISCEEYQTKNVAQLELEDQAHDAEVAAGWDPNP